MRFVLIVIFLLLPPQFVFSQKKTDIARVLDIPPALSGSFGELRSGSFHSGIDFRTQGVTGKNVFAMDDGYISRIRTTTGGYGKALYIEHPGGFTSVYAHLDDFNETIDHFVKNYQYRKQTHTLEIFPGKEKFTVKKGDLIGYSGNTGSSSGPHLHFEIRKTAGQIPLNVMLINDFGIKDNSSPVLYTLAVYPLDSLSQVNLGHEVVYLPLEVNNKGTYQIKGNNVIKIAGKAGFGLEAFDFVNENSLRCGVYAIELFTDKEKIYHYEADKFNFSETRFLNAHIDYPAFKSQKKRLNLLYRKPNNHLSMYKTLVNDGVINASVRDTLEAEIIVKDVAGNKSLLRFVIEGVEYNHQATRKIPEHIAFFQWGNKNHYADDFYEITLPAGALYEDNYFNYSVTEFENNHFPYLHLVHDSLTPIHKPAILRIKADIIPKSLRDKSVIIQVNNNGQKTGIGGNWEGDWLTVPIRNFGGYSIDIDTVSPEIIPRNITPGKDMRNIKSIQFTVDDNLTGISEYNGFINNQWILFEYDPKNKLLFYTFDKTRLESGSRQELEIYVTDGKGNTSMYHTSFLW